MEPQAWEPATLEESLDDSGDCEESRLQGTGGSGAAVKDSMRQTPLAH